MLRSVEVLEGHTLVARRGDVVLWLETGTAGGGPVLPDLLTAIAAVAAGSIPPAGMGARLADLLNAGDPQWVPALVAAAPAESGLQVVVHGWGEVVGEGIRIAGGWADQVLPWPTSVSFGRTGVALAPPAAGSVLDLVDGVVHGDGVAVTLEPRPELTAAPVPAPFPEPPPYAAGPTFVPPAPPEPFAAPPPPEPSPPPPFVPPAPPEPFAAPPTPTPIGAPPVDAPPPPPDPWAPPSATTPAPVAVPPAGATALEAAPPPPSGPPAYVPPPSAPAPAFGPNGRPLLQGARCPQGHLNPPTAGACATCGMAIAQPAALVTDERPALGVLVLDDGKTAALLQDLVLGREPHDDPDVQSGRRRALVITDPTAAISRVHVEVDLDGWDVVLVDRGSPNGTFVLPPGAPAWDHVTPGGRRVLTPGTRVALGPRQLTFEAGPRR